MMNEHELDKIRAMLQEDVDGDAEELIDTVQQLQIWHAPAVDMRQTAVLVDLLAQELVPQRTLWQRAGEWWPLLLVRSQVRVVRGEIWWASALVMVLGLVVTLTTPDANMLPITVIAPLVAAVGVALLYDTDIQEVLELENSTRASVRLLLLARLMLVFGFDLVLALSASMVLALVQAEISLWPLVLSWLAPMAFLSGLAFLLSVALVDPVAGSLFSLGIWGMHLLIKSINTNNIWLYALSLPGLAAPESRVVMLALAVVLVGVALWLVGYSERSIGERA